MHGWNTGLGSVGISLKSATPKSPSLVGSLGGSHMKLALDYALHLSKMWNDKIEAVGGDIEKAKIPRFMKSDLVNDRVDASKMIVESYLTSGYIADNAVEVIEAPGFDSTNRFSQCYLIALELAKKHGWDIAAGAVQENYNDGKHEGATPHVWNITNEGTMVDGQLGGRGHQYVALEIIPNALALKISQADLAQITWSCALGLSKILMNWAMKNIKKQTNESLLQKVIAEIVKTLYVK